MRKTLPVLAALAAACPTAPATAADSAVVVMYHRFGEDGFPATNIRTEQFEAHIAELRKPQYTVLPLPEIIAKLRDGTAMPDRTVAITIDDAYASIHSVAWPRLREAGLPFTVFVATDPVDRQFGSYLSWDQIRELRDAGVTIGHHTRTHAHLPTLSEAAVRAEIAEASARFEAELGAAPELFAYPYGEYTLAIQGIVAEAGFAAAFGQHSGPVHAGDDGFGLPRFALNEAYGGIDRFRTAVNALPLPVADRAPAEQLLTDNPPAFGFTVAADAGGLQQLACYASGLGAVPVAVDGRRARVALDAPFPPGRSRINCTLPAGDGRYRWYGVQYLVPGGAD